MGSRLKIGHLILFFALAAAPFAATFALYYPDERHYTNGALMMLQLYAQHHIGKLDDSHD